MSSSTPTEASPSSNDDAANNRQDSAVVGDASSVSHQIQALRDTILSLAPSSSALALSASALTNDLSRLALQDTINSDDRTTLPAADVVRTHPYHYRHIPATVQAEYDCIRAAALAIPATSIKYALLVSSSSRNKNKALSVAAALAAEEALTALVAPCQSMTHACIQLHDEAFGCAGSTQRHVRLAVLAVLTALVRQLQTTNDNNDDSNSTNAAAVLAGAVEAACAPMVDKTLAMGNRTAMRRDLFTYGLECRSTIDEFQVMILESNNLHKNNNDNQQQQQVPFETIRNDEDDVEDAEDHFTALELPIATAVVTILSCSRGCLTATLGALDAVGDPLHDNTSAAVSPTIQKQQQKEREDRWAWMTRLQDLATAAGMGVTDLGVTLYPPLDLTTVQDEVDRQTCAVEAVVLHILQQQEQQSSSSPDDELISSNASEEIDGSLCSRNALLSWNLPMDVLEVATKIKTALPIRRAQIREAIQKAESKALV